MHSVLSQDVEGALGGLAGGAGGLLSGIGGSIAGGFCTQFKVYIIRNILPAFWPNTYVSLECCEWLYQPE